MIKTMIKVNNQIKKSKLDDRLYRYVKLQNQLKCVLVHDKDVEKSSACMFVDRGSLFDPKDKD
jgi:secreted Zn-dependent insulinase-like peptidase